MIPCKRGYLIINMKTKEYVFTDSEIWEGDWKLNYPHVAKESYIDIMNPSIWPHDFINGLPFTYDLGPNGGYFFIYCDEDTSKAEVEKAKKGLKHDHDVVSLSVLRLKIAIN